MPQNAWDKHELNELRNRLMILQDSNDELAIKSSMYSFLLLLSLITIALLLLTR